MSDTKPPQSSDESGKSKPQTYMNVYPAGDEAASLSHYTEIMQTLFPALQKAWQLLPDSDDKHERFMEHVQFVTKQSAQILRDSDREQKK